MVFNVTYEATTELILAVLLIIFAGILIRAAINRKIQSMLLFGLYWISNAAIFIVDALSYMTLLKPFALLVTILFLPSSLLLLAAINQSMKNEIHSWNLIPATMLAITCIFLAFHPDAITVNSEYGYTTIIWSDLLIFASDALVVYIFVHYGFLAFKSKKQAPYEIQREANAMFWVISCSIIGMISFDMFALLYPPIYVLSNIALSIGTIWLIVIMLKESKVLFILPFELCKLTVLDSQGQGIYEYAWKIIKDDATISPMLGKLVTELNSRMDNAGMGILEIDGTCFTFMKEGSITGILLATKSSLFLKNMLASFLSSFNEVFKDELSRGIQDYHVFRAADSLVEKVFSTIPSRILIKKDQPVRLKIDGSRDPRLHGDLRKTLEEAGNLEMEMEIISSPDDVIEEVNELYDELHDELNDEIED